MNPSPRSDNFQNRIIRFICGLLVSRTSKIPLDKNIAHTYHCCPALRAFSSPFPSAPSFAFYFIYIVFLWSTIFLYSQAYLSVFAPALLVVEAENMTSPLMIRTLSSSSILGGCAKYLTQAGLSNQAVPSLHDDIKGQYCNDVGILLYLKLVAWVIIAAWAVFQLHWYCFSDPGRICRICTTHCVVTHGLHKELLSEQRTLAWEPACNCYLDLVTVPTQKCFLYWMLLVLHWRI